MRIVLLGLNKDALRKRVKRAVDDTSKSEHAGCIESNASTTGERKMSEIQQWCERSANQTKACPSCAITKKRCGDAKSTKCFRKIYSDYKSGQTLLSFKPNK